MVDEARTTVYTDNKFWISIFFSIVFCEVFAIISRKNVREMLVQKKII